MPAGLFFVYNRFESGVRFRRDIMKTADEVKRQMEILTADTAEVIPQKELENKLTKSIENNKPLTVKMGIDPTSPDVHLGHMVIYKKIRQFQDLGHKAVLIIGDYTARIGDPTGRNKERPPLSEVEVQKNSSTYKEQIFKIVDPDKTEIQLQSSWFNKMSLQDLLAASASFSVAHMLTHDTFKKRLESGARLSLHEMFYPVLQAWDSLIIKADVELGGIDQKFNILCGRDMQKEKGLEPQVALLMPLLMGIDGRKMSKSFNNHIPVLSSPSEKFGRIMSINDNLITNFFTYATALDFDQVNIIKERLQTENPRDIKLELAKQLISVYHSPEEADKCTEEFIRIFSKKENPEKMTTFEIDKKGGKITSILKESGLTESISEGNRLMTYGGLKIDGEKITDKDYFIKIKEGESVVIKAGKRRYIKLI